MLHWHAHNWFHFFIFVAGVAFGIGIMIAWSLMAMGSKCSREEEKEEIIKN